MERGSYLAEPVGRTIRSGRDALRGLNLNTTADQGRNSAAEYTGAGNERPENVDLSPENGQDGIREAEATLADRRAAANASVYRFMGTDGSKPPLQEETRAGQGIDSLNNLYGKPPAFGEPGYDRATWDAWVRKQRGDPELDPNRTGLTGYEEARNKPPPGPGQPGFDEQAYLAWWVAQRDSGAADEAPRTTPPAYQPAYSGNLSGVGQYGKQLTPPDYVDQYNGARPPGPGSPGYDRSAYINWLNNQQGGPAAWASNPNAYDLDQLKDLYARRHEFDFNSPEIAVLMAMSNRDIPIWNAYAPDINGNTQQLRRGGNNRYMGPSDR